MRDKITSIFENVGEDYFREGRASYEIHQGKDVHVFYRFIAKPEGVVHVQGYPGMSTEDNMRVWARLLDHGKIIQIRRAGSVSIGNEHEATIRSFESFGHGVLIPYDPRVLQEMLGKECYDLDLRSKGEKILDWLRRKI